MKKGPGANAGPPFYLFQLGMTQQLKNVSVSRAEFRCLPWVAGAH